MAARLHGAELSGLHGQRSFELAVIIRTASSG